MTATEQQKREEDFTEKLAAIKARYQEIIDGLGLKFSLDADFEVIQKNFAAKSAPTMLLPVVSPER